MASTPTPIVVCGAAASDPQRRRGAGAVDMVGASDGPPDLAAVRSSRLRRHLHFASRHTRSSPHPRGKLRRAVGGHRGGRRRRVGTALRTTGPGCTGTCGRRAHGPAARSLPPRLPRPAIPGAAAHTRPTWSPPRPGRPAHRRAPRRLRERHPPVGVDVVVIGASTGGPPALATILGELPRAFPAPILVVQHMAEGFVESLAEWLNSVSPLPVELARDGVRLGRAPCPSRRPGSTSSSAAACGSS
jgi:chemotaxis response regulator CheB